MSLLQMSFAGGVMVLAITIIRALAINLLPKRIFLVLWGIAAARLLLPFSLPFVFSAYSLLARQAPAGDGGKPSRIVEMLPMEMAGQNEAISSGISMWTAIWAAGALICATVFFTVYWRCCKEFRMSLPVDNDFVKGWLSARPRKRPISIRQSGRCSSPLTYGVFHPVILMPASTKWEDLESLQYVLLHEYVHIRRFDSIAKFAWIIALCVHWFNPLAWVMYILANRDIELSCDEAVVRFFGESTRAAYAQMLIRMQETQSGLSALCSNFSKNAMEERITAIMKIRKTTKYSIALACFIAVGTATAFATSANAQPPQADAVEQDGKNDIVFKPDSIPQIADHMGIYFKEDGKAADIDTKDAMTAVLVQSNDIHGMPVDKAGASSDDFSGGNVIYFETEAERDEHFCALQANTEKGLNRYAGLEEMYAGIDTSAPITYLVK